MTMLTLKKEDVTGACTVVANSGVVGDDLLPSEVIVVSEAMKHTGYALSQAVALIREFVGSLPAEQKSIDLVHAQRDWSQVQKLVHKLKGGALYCGVPRVTKACERLEGYLRGDERAQAEKLYEQFIREILLLEEAVMLFE